MARPHFSRKSSMNLQQNEIRIVKIGEKRGCEVAAAFLMFLLAFMPMVFSSESANAVPKEITLADGSKGVLIASPDDQTRYTLQKALAPMHGFPTIGRAFPMNPDGSEITKGPHKTRWTKQVQISETKTGIVTGLKGPNWKVTISTKYSSQETLESGMVVIRNNLNSSFS